MWNKGYTTVFWCSGLKNQIKVTLKTINYCIKQIPEDRRGVIISRLNEMLNKNNQNSEDNDKLQKFLKQLQFNLNFIKLSNPHLDFNPPP